MGWTREPRGFQGQQWAPVWSCRIGMVEFSAGIVGTFLAAPVGCRFVKGLTCSSVVLVLTSEFLFVEHVDYLRKLSALDDTDYAPQSDHCKLFDRPSKLSGVDEFPLSVLFRRVRE